MEDLSKAYRTRDLYYAAYLKVAGVTLLDVEREVRPGGNPGSAASVQVTFLFENQGAPAMRSLKDQYFMDKARVPALSYSQAIKGLKALFFDDSR